MKAHVDHTALKYNLNLHGVKSFLLVGHLPMLVTMVAKFFMCERKVSNFIYFLVFLLTTMVNSTNAKKATVETGWL